MGKTTIITILIAIFAGLAWGFGMAFQTMAYWGPDGTVSWAWFWTGAGASYTCIMLSILLMILNIKDRKVNMFDIFIRAISFFVVVTACLWTTFVVGMWMH